MPPAVTCDGDERAPGCCQCEQYTGAAAFSATVALYRSHLAVCAHLDMRLAERFGRLNARHLIRLAATARIGGLRSPACRSSEIGYQYCENSLVSYGSSHAKLGWLSV